MKKLNLFRIIIFFVSVIALSKFFEAGRLISSEMTLAHISTSILSGLVFILSLLFMGYWIYVEEKEKNNLKINFGLFEWVYRKWGKKG